MIYKIIVLLLEKLIFEFSIALCYLYAYIYVCALIINKIL